MAKSVHAKIEADGAVDEALAALPVVMRTQLLPKAMRAAGNVVKKRARQLCPPPGYPGDKPDKKPLRDTIGVVVRQYDNVVMTVVGPQYPAGAHGHLVEFGHRIARGGTLSTKAKGKTGRRAMGTVSGFVKPKPFLRPAVDETKQQQDDAIITVLVKGFEDNG